MVGAALAAVCMEASPKRPALAATWCSLGSPNADNFPFRQVINRAQHRNNFFLPRLWGGSGLSGQPAWERQEVTEAVLGTGCRQADTGGELLGIEGYKVIQKMVQTTVYTTELSV